MTNTRRDDNSLTGWMCHVPSDWQVDRLANISEVIFSNVDKHMTEGEKLVRLCNYVDVYNNDQITAVLDFMEASANPREISRFQIYRGDVLVTKDSETAEDIAISALVADDLPGILCGYHLAIVRPRTQKLYGPYLAWVHRSKPFRAQYEAKAVGVTRFGLARRDFKETLVAFPLISEQKYISTYLDASCAAIDVAIRAKQEQIELLGVLRTTLIEEAVTRGIRANPALRRVGEDWIEQIPEHWTACRIKRVALRMDYGISVSTEREGRFPVLKMGNVQEGELSHKDLEFVEEVPDDLLLETGDLLYNRTNSPDQVGKAAVFRGNKADGLTFASYLVRLRTNHRANPYFLNYVVNSSGFLGFARKLAIPSVQQSNLNSTRYGRMFIPLPPVPEQKEIASFLDEKTAELRRVIDGIREQIGTLSAYRNSLIHECVTGQRRVTAAELKHAKAYA